MRLPEWACELADYIFPRVCHLCDATLSPHERFVCTECIGKLPRTRYHSLDFNPMEERFAGIFPFTRATGHFFYSRGSGLSQLIQDMKYRNFPGIGERLGETAGVELFSTGFFDGIDMIVPVPMHFMKKARRGYNQTDHIAAGVGRASGITVAFPLKAARPHKTQTAMTLEQRRQNIDGTFRLTDPDSVRDKGVLLVDDVCTTGSTLTAAAETILAEEPTARLSMLTIGVTF